MCSNREDQTSIDTLGPPASKKRRSRSISNASTLEGDLLTSSDSEEEEILIFPTSFRRTVSESQSFVRNAVDFVVIVNSELEAEHKDLWVRAADTLAELEGAIEHFSVRDLRVINRSVALNQTVSSALLLRRKIINKP